jgi:hypothetical protein
MLLSTSAVAPSAWAADAFPYGDSHVFAAWRNGQLIGHHALRFSEEGGQRHVSTSIDLGVRLLGLPFYKFNHRCHEVWELDACQQLTADTDDNGAKYSVRVRRTPQGLDVEHEGSGALVKTSIGDEVAALHPSGHEVLPPDTLPTTHWNIAQVRQHTLLHTEYGTLYRIAVTTGGREIVRTASGSLSATRYDYSGQLQMTQWFDDRARWVHGEFKAHDGSIIEYILQE